MCRLSELASGGSILHQESNSTHAQEQDRVEGHKAEDSPSQLIDAKIKDLSDWRGEMLARVRKLIKEADSDIVEEVRYIYDQL